MKDKYITTEKEIKNAIFQQVMSKFRPDLFSILLRIDIFVPRTKLEKLVVANLKRH